MGFLVIIIGTLVFGFPLAAMTHFALVFLWGFDIPLTLEQILFYAVGLVSFIFFHKDRY